MKLKTAALFLSIYVLYNNTRGKICALNLSNKKILFSRMYDTAANFRLDNVYVMLSVLKLNAHVIIEFNRFILNHKIYEMNHKCKMKTFYFKSQNQLD